MFANISADIKQKKDVVRVCICVRKGEKKFKKKTTRTNCKKKWEEWGRKTGIKASSGPIMTFFTRSGSTSLRFTVKMFGKRGN